MGLISHWAWVRPITINNAVAGENSLATEHIGATLDDAGCKSLLRTVVMFTFIVTIPRLRSPDLQSHASDAPNAVLF